MLIRIVDGNVIQLVCVQCAQDNDIQTEGATWAKAGWCFLCGWKAGGKGDSSVRRQANLRKLLALTGTDIEECPPYPQGPREPKGKER